MISLLYKCPQFIQNIHSDVLNGKKFQSKKKKFGPLGDLYNPRFFEAFLSCEDDLYDDDDIQGIISEAVTLLRSHKFKINPEKVYIEMHRYEVDDNTLDPEFDWHVDDDNVLDGPVCTVIFYISKDPGIKGGNLEFESCIISIAPPMSVMFTGDLLHRPGSMSGHGVRDSVVVMFPRSEF